MNTFCYTLLSLLGHSYHPPGSLSPLGSTLRRVLFTLLICRVGSMRSLFFVGFVCPITHTTQSIEIIHLKLSLPISGARRDHMLYPQA